MINHRTSLCRKTRLVAFDVGPRPAQVGAGEPKSLANPLAPIRQGSQEDSASFGINKFRTPDVAPKEIVRFWGAHEAGAASWAGFR